MASSGYALGSALERRVKDRFERAGYYVLRSSLSRGAADLLALDALEDAPPVMIQCKRGGGLAPEAWNHFLKIATMTRCTALVAEQIPSGGSRYWAILGPKDGSGSRQPWEPWELRPAPARRRVAPVLHVVPVGRGGVPYAEEDRPLPPAPFCIECGHDHLEQCGRCSCPRPYKR